MQTAYVHPRLGLPSFLKFEPFFLEALRQWPKETKFNISQTLSPNTIIARMRDSLSGFRLNRDRWLPSINPEFVKLFDQYEGQYVFCLVPDATDDTLPAAVWFKHRRQRGNPNNLNSFHQVSGELHKHIRSESFVTHNMKPVEAQGILMNGEALGQEDYNFLAHLVAIHAFQSPLFFQGDVTNNFVEASLTMDVTAHFNPNRNETIVM